MHSNLEGKICIFNFKPTQKEKNEMDSLFTRLTDHNGDKCIVSEYLGERTDDMLEITFDDDSRYLANAYELTPID